MFDEEEDSTGLAPERGGDSIYVVWVAVSAFVVCLRLLGLGGVTHLLIGGFFGVYLYEKQVPYLCLGIILTIFEIVMWVANG